MTLLPAVDFCTDLARLTLLLTDASQGISLGLAAADEDVQWALLADDDACPEGYSIVATTLFRGNAVSAAARLLLETYRELDLDPITD